MLFVAFSIILGSIVRKRYRFGVISIVLGGVFLFGYFHTYLECNRVGFFRLLSVDLSLILLLSTENRSRRHARGY